MGEIHLHITRYMYSIHVYSFFYSFDSVHTFTFKFIYFISFIWMYYSWLYSFAAKEGNVLLNELQVFIFEMVLVIAMCIK